MDRPEFMEPISPPSTSRNSSSPPPPPPPNATPIVTSVDSSLPPILRMLSQRSSLYSPPRAVVEETPTIGTVEETTVTSTIRTEEEGTTVTDQNAAVEETTVTSTIGTDEETTVTDQIGVVEETTVTDQTGVVEETTVTDQIGVVEETTVTDQIGVVEETTVTDQTGVVEETTVTSTIGTDEETTVTDQNAVEETTVTNEEEDHFRYLRAPDTPPLVRMIKNSPPFMVQTPRQGPLYRQIQTARDDDFGLDNPLPHRVSPLIRQRALGSQDPVSPLLSPDVGMTDVAVDDHQSTTSDSNQRNQLKKRIIGFLTATILHIFFLPILSPTLFLSLVLQGWTESVVFRFLLINLCLMGILVSPPQTSHVVMFVMTFGVLSYLYWSQINDLYQSNTFLQFVCDMIYLDQFLSTLHLIYVVVRPPSVA